MQEKYRGTYTINNLLHLNGIQMYTHQGFYQNRMLLDNFSSAMKIEES